MFVCISINKCNHSHGNTTFVHNKNSGVTFMYVCMYVCLFFVILEKSTFSTSISLRFWIFKYVVCNVVISEFVFKFVNYCFLAQETSREIDEIRVFITDISVTSEVEFWGFYLKKHFYFLFLFFNSSFKVNVRLKNINLREHNYRYWNLLKH